MLYRKKYRLKVGKNYNSEVNWGENIKFRWRQGEKTAWNVPCMKTMERIKRKLIVSLRRERSDNIGRTAEDKRVGFPDNL